MTPPPIALTIAGSDPSGGAGIQADLKTFHQHGVYGTSVITLLTVQNTQRVSRVEVMHADLVVEQLDAVLTDVRPAAMKTGALGSAAVVRAVAARLAEEPSPIPLVVDPVMISKHGHALIADDAIDACVEALLPRATLVTPNVPEAERLLGARLPSRAAIEEGALALASRWGVPVLIKGGHVEGHEAGGDEAVDVLALKRMTHTFSAPRVRTRHTHGTGCTYSAAITARLAGGASLHEAIAGAKAWLTSALRRAPGIGEGIGPVDHLTPL
ncbi:MAG: bifunctional hydroxymethylpyrimidine kinase/phosphomethylpyrimidine kinase [Sandaracinaceae bacterium]